MNLRNFKNAQARRIFLEKDLKINLSNIGNFSFSEDEVANHNIENPIGAGQIPLGVAGPIRIKGQYASGEFYLPLATTEGALVASVSRGAKAITLSSGATTRIENVGATRAPVFAVSGIKEGQEFIFWIEKNFSSIKKICESTSKHLRLLEIKSWMVGKNVWLRFCFDTKDAMGMNMATMAVDKAVRELIRPKTKVECIALSGNLCVDKKPSFLNFILGRGKKVWAESLIKRKTAVEILKTTPEKLDEAAKSKILYGSILAGSLGANQQAANVVAGIFAATGQDLGHIVEGSMVVTTTEIVSEDFYISVYLPDLMIGTAGGGTGLPSQKESLAILGIPDGKLSEGKQVLKLGEIIGAAVLSGELSLLAALASGDLAKAHERLGRGKI
ncbi:hydroxymethylglutaryl-CoA reductase [Candidatus Gottesmanbacteria bacterium]|nr:hydroxymethylglutaryl-CoA reductase [Candidatus Gottesmanbacteria bacterium]